MSNMPNNMLTMKPCIDFRKVEALAKFCNENNINMWQLLDIGLSAMLVDILSEDCDSEYSNIDPEKLDRCQRAVEYLQKGMNEWCTNDFQKMLGLTFLLKSQLVCLLKQ